MAPARLAAVAGGAGHEHGPPDSVRPELGTDPVTAAPSPPPQGPYVGGATAKASLVLAAVLSRLLRRYHWAALPATAGLPPALTICQMLEPVQWAPGRRVHPTLDLSLTGSGTAALRVRVDGRMAVAFDLAA